MKKYTIILISLILILSGCSTNKKTSEKRVKYSNEEMEKILLGKNYEITYSEVPKNYSTLEVISFKSKEHEIFYNSNITYGIFNKDKYLISISAKKGFYNIENRSTSCEYNLDNKNDYLCTYGDIEEIDALYKKFNNVLSMLNITESEFIDFAEYELKKEQKKFRNLDTGDKLLKVGFKLENGLYTTYNFENDGFETWPHKIALDLENHKMVVTYWDTTYAYDWDTEIITEKFPDREACTFDYNKNFTDCPDLDLAIRKSGFNTNAFSKTLENFEREFKISLERTADH